MESGADALGFNFWPGSRRFIAPRDAGRIVAALPAGVLCVGVFVNEEDPATVRLKAREAGVGAAQLHGEESPDYCRRLEGLTVIKALRVGPGFRPEQAALYGTEAVLLDAFAADAPGGTGRTFDWSQAKRACALVPKLFLAGGLTPENVAGAVRAVGPYGVDVCSGVEGSPGRKDLARIRRFIEAARAAESSSFG